MVDFREEIRGVVRGLTGEAFLPFVLFLSWVGLGRVG